MPGKKPAAEAARNSASPAKVLMRLGSRVGCESAWVGM